MAREVGGVTPITDTRGLVSVAVEKAPTSYTPELVQALSEKAFQRLTLDNTHAGGLFPTSGSPTL